MTQRLDEDGNWVPEPEMGADRVVLRPLAEVLNDIDLALVSVGATNEQRAMISLFIKGTLGDEFQTNQVAYLDTELQQAKRAVSPETRAFTAREALMGNDGNEGTP